VHFLLSGGRASGRELLVSTITVWLTNVLVFAFWYWELDRGGLASRRLAGGERRGFLFPQQAISEPRGRDTSSTTCTSRSPTRRRWVRPTRFP